ncbi:MAG TPA: prolyl oligopeptidase family serine peptidase [Terriglobales bacterium]|jgi:prolyl oligopeptidase|nr:prolyl oligopeptidase family serine peptidase [Terriglobales bacterium]
MLLGRLRCLFGTEYSQGSTLSRLCVAVLCASLLGVQTTTAPSGPPVTRKVPVTTEYHGTKVTEYYRWLENGQSLEVKRWVALQNQYTRNYLDHLPARSAIKREIEEFYKKSSPRYSDIQYAGHVYFARKLDPQKQQPVLVTLKSPDDVSSERIIVDPAQMPAKNLSIDWYFPSLDGRLVGVAVSPGGSEDASLYVFEVASGKKLDDVIPRVNYATAGGGMAWISNGAGFYYTRYPQGTERPKADANFYQQIYFHSLGTDPAESDRYILGKDFPRIAEITLDSQSSNGKYVMATVANGDGGEFEHFLLTQQHSWKQITRFQDKVVSATVTADDNIYLLSRDGAPKGKVLQLSASDPRLSAATTIVPEQTGSITNPGIGGDLAYRTIIPTAGRLYVLTVNGGPNELISYDHDGKPQGKVPIADVSSVNQVVAIEGDQILYNAETFTTPTAWYRYNGPGNPVKTALATTSPVNFSDTMVTREEATSKDGTKIPMTIIRRKDAKLDGSNPTMIYGYGGYGITETPSFLGINGRLWLDQGGIYVDTNLRGGSEYGEEWHQAGMLTRKQNVFDDFAACALYLIDQKYTSPEHLVAMGGSNGGLLMGAELTQHPELFRAVVSYVGIYDMLRTELDPNGSFNTTEYGTVKDPAQFQALYAYSPYHHVKEKTNYPAVLFLTGDNDARVNPAHSRKMTAALQAATNSGHPVFLRTTSKAGHGFGTALSERIEQAADVNAFIFDQLGIKFVPTGSGGSN